MKKSRYIFLGLAMILMLAGCGANRKTIRFGAAGIGGMYDSFANAYVSLANKEDFSYKLETRNTAGSAANVRLLSGKYIELGIAQADLVEEAYHGTGEFRDKAYQGYKAVAALYPEACQIVVRADSEIETLDDLLGKTISIGADSAGTGHQRRYGQDRQFGLHGGGSETCRWRDRCIFLYSGNTDYGDRGAGKGMRNPAVEY